MSAMVNGKGLYVVVDVKLEELTSGMQVLRSQIELPHFPVYDTKVTVLSSRESAAWNSISRMDVYIWGGP
jgi:hypothetical protein